MFWKLVPYLQTYGGATALLLKAGIVESYQPKAEQEQPVARTNSDGSREVKAELLNLAVGDSLISWGSGG